MKVIGSGVGRTGTLSLKLALERVGFGPCHHMLEVKDKTAAQLPLWEAALDGHPDWQAIYNGYQSSGDRPTAGFAQELIAAYPEGHSPSLASFDGTLTLGQHRRRVEGAQSCAAGDPDAPTVTHPWAIGPTQGETS